jgi:hypothetical protein
MAIRKWHFGKLIILWSWGILLSALAVTHFVISPVPGSPLLHLVELLFVLVVLIALSIVTWRWLGSKDAN